MDLFNLTNFSIAISDEYNECTFTNQILLRYVGITIFFFGIISTILSICVFTRKPLRKCKMSILINDSYLFSLIFFLSRTEVLLFLFSYSSHQWLD